MLLLVATWVMNQTVQNCQTNEVTADVNTEVKDKLSLALLLHQAVLNNYYMPWIGHQKIKKVMAILTNKG